MNRVILFLLPIFSLFISACGVRPAETQIQPPATLTTGPDQDPCSLQNLPTTVQPISDLMREFEEASQQASSLSAQQLPQVILNLQRIRRATEDVQVPACLATLKTHQLNHMNIMIETLLAFVGGGGQEALNTGLEAARKEYDLYSLEMVRLLGITLVPVTATP